MGTRDWRRWRRILWRATIGLTIAGVLLFFGLGIWGAILAGQAADRLRLDLAAVYVDECVAGSEAQSAHPEGLPTVSRLKTHPEAQLDYPGSKRLNERGVDIQSCDGYPDGPEHPGYVVVYLSTSDGWGSVKDFYAASLRARGWMVTDADGIWQAYRGLEFFALYEPNAKEQRDMRLPQTAAERFATFYSIRLTGRSYAPH